jgi:hypothetical protein
MLFEMGDKPQEFIGTSEWIGAFEVSMLLNKITNVVLYLFIVVRK